MTRWGCCHRLGSTRSPAIGFTGATRSGPARLIAALRQLGLPLAEIKVVIGLEPGMAADRIADYWSGIETEHAARRNLADFVANDYTERELLCTRWRQERFPGAVCC